jgi:hypothetical protein
MLGSKAVHRGTTPTKACRESWEVVEMQALYMDRKECCS